MGHNPCGKPAFALNEDCSMITVMGKSEKLVEIEAWAVGSNVTEQMAKHCDVRKWERREVAFYIIS